MIEIRVDGRIAVTVPELARRLGKSDSAVRGDIRRRQIKPAGYVTKNVPVYYPADLGLEATVRTWTLSTELTPGALGALIAEFSPGLEVSGPTGFYGGASASITTEGKYPPEGLEAIRRFLVDRGDRASY